MTDLFHNPEPVFRLGGNAVPALTSDALYVGVEESTLGLRTLELHLVGEVDDHSVDDGLVYLDGSVIELGTQIEVSLGADADARTVFKGLVTALEGSLAEGQAAKVVVLAEDPLMTLRLTRRCKTYEKTTDAGIAKEIATAHSLKDDAIADGPEYPYVQQWNQSDLAFLRERARLVEAEVYIENDALCFKQRGQRKGTQLTLVRGQKLLNVEIRADLAHQRSKVSVSGYDAQRKDTINKAAEASAISSEASGGKSGIAILAKAIPDKPLSSRATLRVREAPHTDGEAEAFAKAELLRRARSFVTAVGTTSGSPDLTVSSRLTFERVGRPFNGGDYYVTRFKHAWARGGTFRTHFEAERPYLAGRA